MQAVEKGRRGLVAVIILLLVALFLLYFYVNAKADGPYQSCPEAAFFGRVNIPSGDPKFNPKLDRDYDGFACDE